MKKIMVISFDSFNLTNSNGRSLGTALNLLGDNVEISEIYIKGKKPDFVKGKYCYIPEHKLIKNFFNANKVAEFFDVEKEESNKENPVENISKAYSNKTSFKMILRNFVWKLTSFHLKKIYKWASEIKPDYILVTCGDLPFLYDLGRKLAKKTGAKLMFYTTENYPLKTKNYLSNKTTLAYKIFHKTLYKSCKKMSEECCGSLYLTESLRDEFNEHYSLKGDQIILRPFSDIQPMNGKTNNENPIFSYCGNLGIGRYKTICGVAEALNKYNSKIKLLVCGPCSDYEKNELLKHKNIDYLGVVPYSEVINIYLKSDFILHIETLDESKAEDLKHAFSGKIIDCLSTHKPIIFFGSEIMFEYNFLRNNNAALTYSKISDFENDLRLNKISNYEVDPSKQSEIIKRYFSKETAIASLSKLFNI